MTTSTLYNNYSGAPTVPGFSYNMAVLQDNPLLYWEMGGNSTSLIDSSGNNNNGTYGGTILPNQTKLAPGLNSSVYFNGSNSYGAISTSALNILSYELWFSSTEQGCLITWENVLSTSPSWYDRRIWVGPNGLLYGEHMIARKK